MSQNIYDTPDFFDNYAQMARSKLGLDGALEWPQLRSMLPEMEGLRVLDLGCGYGWFSRWAVLNGAQSVLGIDLSNKMLQMARSKSAGETYQGITYQRGDLDDLQLSADHHESYDLAFSSLALHYLVNCAALVRQVHAVLKPGGSFVFSIEHPIYTAPSKPGVVQGEGGHRYWRLDNYQKQGERVTDWLAERVRKQHRTVTSYVNMLLDAGFELTGFNEWYPTKEELEARPDLSKEWGNETIKPTFLFMQARKKM